MNIQAVSEYTDAITCALIECSRKRGDDLETGRKIVIAALVANLAAMVELDANETNNLAIRLGLLCGLQAKDRN